MKFQHLFVVAITAVILAGCAGNRNVAGDFISINSGQIQKSKVLEFVDCVSDTFHDRSFGLERMLNRQQRRSNGYRVELVNTGVGTILSADIFEDGRVELFEWSKAGLISTGDERKGFALCLDKHRIVQ